MSSSFFFNYVCVSLFLLLAVQVDSQGIAFPGPNPGSSDCNCVVIMRCPALSDRSDWTTAGETCGYGTGQYRRVCCPSETPPTQRPRVQTTTDLSTKSGVCGLSNYEEEPFKPLIVGGENATDGQWPWMVAIRMRESTNYYGRWCSGFLIDRRHVLSAAHCYKERDDDRYRARIGNINQNIAEEYRIIRIVVPDGYREGLFYDDIAILTLDRDVHFPNFNPVCLPNADVSRMNLINKGTTVAGWGADKYRGEMKDYLQFLSRLPVISHQECQRKLREKLRNAYRRQFPNGVSSGFICAAFKEGNKDACGGDSGGPQMIQNGNRWYAVGVVSFGFRCGEPGMPGGYTRVSNHVKWIEENTRD